MTTMRDSSRRDWNSKNTLSQIDSGSLQRIADAVERTAQRHTELIDKLEACRGYINRLERERDSIARSNAALRGQITKLKKRLADSEAATT